MVNLNPDILSWYFMSERDLIKLALGGFTREQRRALLHVRRRVWWDRMVLRRYR